MPTHVGPETLQGQLQRKYRYCHRLSAHPRKDRHGRIAIAVDRLDRQEKIILQLSWAMIVGNYSGLVVGWKGRG